MIGVGADQQAEQVPRHVLWLGYGGLVPFAGSLAALLALPAPWAAWGLISLLSYGACILSFLGGVQWGFALMPERAGRASAGHLALAVLPALAGWLALLVGGAAGLALLALGFALMLAGDAASRRAARSPAWYLRLRGPLSACVIAMLFAGALSTSI